ncbi:MAG: DUF167 domain-containing protein [Parachlamydia sp.]|jgi:hypothetical protein|nr:DUF167 domain-containing protein [Parachlamydia sp.]
MLQETIIKIKVISNASRSEIIGWIEGVLKIRLAAVPAKGEANAELIHYLSKVLSLGRSKIKIVKGETARLKQICIQAPLSYVLQKLNHGE